VWTGQDGSVWLRRWNTLTDLPARWIVLDPNGRARGEMVLPGTARPAWSDGNSVWMVDSDEFGVPWLIHLRIEST
jgi:hypothetical protein